VFFIHPFPDAKLFILVRLFFKATGSGRRNRFISFDLTDAAAAVSQLPAFLRGFNSIVHVL
jgi:hypothetical protein